MNWLERLLKPRTIVGIKQETPRKKEEQTPPSRLATEVYQGSEDALAKKQQGQEKLLASKEKDRLKEVERIRLLEEEYQAKIKPFYEHLEREDLPHLVRDFETAMETVGKKTEVITDILVFDGNELLKFGRPTSFFVSSGDPFRYNNDQYKKSNQYVASQHREEITRVSKEPIKAIGHAIYWDYKRDYSSGDEFTYSQTLDRYSSSVAIFSVQDDTGRHELQIVNNDRVFKPSGKEEIINTFVSIYRNSLGLE